ncbi:PqqD family protein [Ancylobacter sp. IITR112]|uniref:PqqD family protein n=1 Tax=Ancylobacter sp. IITR112 TaxID=3138073 RepID=UPI00352A3685
MPPISLNSRVRRKTGLLSVEMNGDIVTLNEVLGEYYSLNDVASDIWKRLEEPVKVADLVTALAEDYDGDPAEIGTDVLDWLGILHEKGLIAIEG